MHMRATQQHFHHGLLLSTPKEKKENKTIYTRKLPTSKRRTRNLFGFFLLIITSTGMESKLAKSYNYFLVFLKVFQTHKKKLRKENKLAWIVQ